MDCIYFDNGDCRAQPFSKMVRRGVLAGFYKPSDDEIRTYCKAQFTGCPRFKAYQEHLKSAK